MADSESEVYSGNMKGLSRSDDDGSSSSSDGDKRKHDDETGDEEDIDGVAIEDPVPKKQKISMGFNKTFGIIKSAAVKECEKKNVAPITIKLGPQKARERKSALRKASASVASAFNQESDEEEEMPPEAKMRMRNIGRDTPTSAGPNSFGKTRQGFCDSKKVFERQLKEKMDEVGEK